MSAHKKFAAFLYSAYVRSEKTQEEFSTELGLSVRHFQNLVSHSAEPRLSTAVRIAEILDYDLNLLKETASNPDATENSKVPSKRG